MYLYVINNVYNGISSSGRWLKGSLARCRFSGQLEVEITPLQRLSPAQVGEPIKRIVQGTLIKVIGMRA